MSDIKYLVNALEEAQRQLEEWQEKIDYEWGSCRGIRQIEDDGELNEIIVLVRDALAKARGEE